MSLFPSGDNPEDTAGDSLSDENLNIIAYTIKETAQQGSFLHSTIFSNWMVAYVKK